MINSVENIDGIFVGPNDLTTSMGIPDERTSKEYEDILKKIIETSEKILYSSNDTSCKYKRV